MKACTSLKKLFVLILVVAMTMLIASCGSGTRLNIGFFPNITHSQALCAFADESIENALGDLAEVNWFMFNAGPAEAEALRSGSIDIGYIGPIPAITAFASSNGSLKIIGSVACGGSMLVTSGNVKISDISELSGLTVAVPQFGNTQDIILRGLLAEAGLASTENGGTVEVIQQPNANIKALLADNKIDAALVPEPWGSQLVIEAGAQILLDHDDIFGGNYPVAVIVARKDYLEQNRDIVKSFLKEHLRATDVINSEPWGSLKKANDIINTLTGVALADDVIEATYSRITFDAAVSEEALTSLIDLCRKQGIINMHINYDDIVDTSLLEEILSEQSTPNTAS